MWHDVILGSRLQWSTSPWPYNPATMFQPSSSHLVCAESFSHWPGSLCRKSTQVWSCIFWQVYMWDGTMSHTANECHLTMLSDGILQRLNLADNDTMNWLDWTVMKALVRWDWKEESYSSCYLEVSRDDGWRRTHYMRVEGWWWGCTGRRCHFQRHHSKTTPRTRTNHTNILTSNKVSFVRGFNPTHLQSTVYSPQQFRVTVLLLY